MTAIVLTLYFSQVFLFLRAVCKQVLPKELLGSKINQRKFFKHLEKFTRLRKGEKFSLSQIMNGIRVAECEWLKGNKNKKQVFTPLSQSVWQRQTFEKCIIWIMNGMLIPILRGYFYVTESGPYRNRVFYYRKSVWQVIHNLSLKTYVPKLFKPISDSEVKTSLESLESLGCSTVRFLPNPQKIRPIINMCKPNYSTDGKWFAPVNNILKNLFQTLGFEKERQPKRLGSSVFGQDDVHRLWSKFLTKIRQRNIGDVPLYFVSVDIDSCFNTMLHDKLFTIIDNSLAEYDYRIRKFKTVMLDNDGNVKSIFRKQVSCGSDCELFPIFLENLLKTNTLKISDSIIVDHVYHSIDEKTELMSQLRKHVTQGIVRIGNNHYKQVRGKLLFFFFEKPNFSKVWLINFASEQVTL